MKHKLLVALFVFTLLGGASAQGGSERATGQINSALSGFFGEGGTTNVTPEQAAAVDPAQFEYTYDPSVTPQVHEQVLSVFTTDAPGSREAAQSILNQLTLEQQQAIMAEGFPDGTWSATNMVDVISATVITAYGILQNLENTTPEQDAAVRALFRVAFANTDLPTSSNTEKQLATEPLLLATIITAAQYAQAREGVQGFSLADLQEGARQTLQAFGLDPQFFTLGASGLELTPEMQRVQRGELTMEQSFPEVMAELDALGVEPVVPGTGGATTGDATTGDATTGGTAVQSPPVGTTDTTTPVGTDATQGATQADATPSTTQAQTGGSDPSGPAVNPLAPPDAPDPFVGAFSDGALTLTLDGDAGAYTGSMDLGGQSYPVQATANGNALSGTFSSSGATFTFSATLDGTVLRLESDGNIFTLERQAPANPLGN